MRRLLSLLTAGLLGCAPVARPPASSQTTQVASVAPARPAMTLSQAGIVPEWLDRAADPCRDFFAFACGGFVQTAQIPNDRSSWSAIEIVVQQSEQFLKQVLEDAAREPGDDPVQQKLGAYYAACMDEPAIERAGIAPIQPLLAIANSATDPASTARAIIALHAESIFAFFAVSPMQDYGDATQVIASLDQDGLGLPDRKYYLEDAGRMAQTRKVYLDHVLRLFRLLGYKDDAASAAAHDVLQIETALARLQQDQVVRRDPHAIYHRVDREGLERTIAPSFPWAQYFAGLGIADVTAITVNDPAYYGAVMKLIAAEKPRALRNYLTRTVLSDQASRLGAAWVEEGFTMRRELAGIKELPPRWRRCVKRTDKDLGELLAQSYVTTKFSADAKASAIALTRSVLGAMRAELDNLRWMDDPTRAAAKQKLDKMAYLVGFPAGASTTSRSAAPITPRTFAARCATSWRACSARSASRSTASTGR